MVAIVASKVMRIGSDKLYDPFIQKILKFIYSEKVTKCCKMSTVELSYVVLVKSYPMMLMITDCGCTVRKSPSLHGRKSNPTPKFIGTPEAYFVCHISPKFQDSLIYALIGCPYSVLIIIEDGYFSKIY